MKRRPYALQLLVLFALYVATALLGLHLRPVSRFATLVWAPTGISLAALLLLGVRLWPAVAAGTFLTNLIVGAPIAAACGMALGNTGEALVGVYLLRRYAGFDEGFGRIRDVAGLIIAAGLVSTLVSATIGVTSVYLAGKIAISEYWHTWSRWWIGDMLGDILLASFLFSWSGQRLRGISRLAIIEIIVVALATIGIASQVFWSMPAGGILGTHELYLLFCPIVWSGLRFSIRETTTLALVISIVAIKGTIQGLGPFIGLSPSENLLYLQLFMGVLTSTGLFLAAAVNERREAWENLSIVVESSPCGMVMVDPKGTISIVNKRAERLFGYTRDELIGRNGEILVPTNLRGSYVRAIGESFEKQDIQSRGFEQDLVGRRKDCSQFDMQLGINSILTPKGRRALVSIIDISGRKQTEDTLRFLSETSAILSESLDYLETLRKVAHVMLPRLADWCLVDLAGEDTKQAVAAHSDPEKEKIAEELAARFPPDQSLGRGAGYVIHTGKAEIY